MFYSAHIKMFCLYVSMFILYLLLLMGTMSSEKDSMDPVSEVDNETYFDFEQWDLVSL